MQGADLKQWPVLDEIIEWESAEGGYWQLAGLPVATSDVTYGGALDVAERCGQVAYFRLLASSVCEKQ